MISKLIKHSTILKRILFHDREIAGLKKFDNKVLNIVLNAIEIAKSDRFNEADRHLFAASEKYRAGLLNNETIITYEVFGLDSTNTVKNICRNATSPPKWCKLHYSLAKETGAKNYLEIGTNLGVSGSYILSAIKSKTGSKLTTMEGLPQLCRIAGANFEKIAGNDSFEIIQGLYDETFPKLMKRDVLYDVVFIDGNHKKKPTLEYFNLLKTKTPDKAVFVFDDINWDQEMKEAWKIIKADKDINFSLDLYKLGIVIIDKTEKPQKVNAELFYAY